MNCGIEISLLKTRTWKSFEVTLVFCVLRENKSGTAWATKIIEYSDPAGPHPYKNGEKYKK